MAKKKSGVARVVKSSRRRPSRRKNPAAVALPLAPNPSLAVDFTSYIVPGFAGYAAARAAAKLAYKTLRKRGPGWAQAASPLASAAVAGGIFAYSHYAKPEYASSPVAHSAMVGASIATIQNTVQALMPQLGWLVGDCYHDDILVPKGAKLVPANAQVSMPRANGAGQDDDDIDIASLLDNSDLLGGGGGPDYSDNSDLFGGEQPGAAPSDEYDDFRSGIFAS